MKWIFKIIGVLFIILIVWIFGKKILPDNVSKKNIFPLPTPSTPSSPLVIPKIEFNGKNYAYIYFTVSTSERIMLIPNFSEKLTSQDLATRYGCIEGINGGFYDTNNTPLGGFMTNNNVFKNPVHNRLIDGFIWENKNGFSITVSEPPSDALFFLQTGPLLRIDGGVTTISIGNDEYRRRSIAGITKNNSLVFFMIYNPESVYEGPLLSDVPSIMESIDQKESLNLDAAVNLDGGSASAFISKNKTLQEFSPIGSFFCVMGNP